MSYRRSVKRKQPQKPTAAFKKPNTTVLRLTIVILLCLIACVALAVVLQDAMRVNSFLTAFVLHHQMAIGGGILFALGVGAYVLLRVRKVDMSKWAFTPLMAAGIGLLAGINGLFILQLGGNGNISILLLTVIIATVLYFVYCLYLRIFYR